MNEVKNKIGEVVGSDIYSLHMEANRSHENNMTSGFSWDDRENMFFMRYKNPKEETESVYSTGELQSLVIDKACRIMAQPATGFFTNIADGQIANTIAANLVYNEHILPNAKQGGDMLTKDRMVDIYSHVYGAMPVFFDWVSCGRYTGPDMILVHPRRFKPQPGKISIDDMEYCFVDVPVSKEWLEKKAKEFSDVWGKGVSFVFSKSKDGYSQSDTSGQTVVERNEQPTKRSGYLLRHFFKSNGDWILYEANSSIVVIDEKKYNIGIPMTEKQTIPLLDRYWGLSDYERGESSQKALDTLTRRYFDTLDMLIDPPAIMDPEDVVMSSIVRGPRKNWFVKDGKVGGIQFANVSPQALSTFQSTNQIVRANLMSLGASGDTSVPKSIDPGMGKTPEALKMQAEREGSRDSWDRFMMERFIEKRANKMMELVVKHKGVGGATIRNIQEALERVRVSYAESDIAFLGNGKINDTYLTGDFRYSVDPGSTQRRGDSGEKILSLLQSFEKNPMFIEWMKSSGKGIDFGELMKRVAIDSGTPNWDKVIIDLPKPESVPGIGSPAVATPPSGISEQEVNQEMQPL